jgi:16S rRNA (cytosine967-C5)-methyltransferase
MQISPARRAAFQILRRVEDENAYSSALLAEAEDSLNPKDKALCHELVLGILRRQLSLDRAVEHFASRKIDSLDLAVVIALRLGLYQLRFLSRVPGSAAINESVNLVKAARVKSAAGFVNAVLRRATREPNYDPAAEVDDAIEKIAVQSSHPRWLIERWADQFGIAEAAAMADANNEPGTVSFRLTAKALRGDAESPAEIIGELRDGGANFTESAIARGAWQLRDSRDGEMAGRDAGVPQARMPALLRKFSDDGLIYFQDEASQLVAHLLGARDGERVLDVCAAPGSKSTLIAALAPHSKIIAGDLYEHRAQTMKKLSARQHATNIHFAVHDATNALPFAPRSFERVLVDAPCSGTGTLRQNPEIRWRLRPSDFDRLVDKQRKILDYAGEMLAAGGCLLYSTCSLETEENEGVSADFLAHHDDFEVMPLRAPHGLVTKAGSVRTWPHRHNSDGFFATAFRRYR